MAKIEGTYKLDLSENFDEFMKALGVGMVMRKMANSATPVVTVSKEEETYTIKQATTFKTTEIKFKLGEEFEETTADGRVVKSTITLDGSKLLHKQVGDASKKEKDSTMDREFTDTHMNMLCKVDDITCKRNYKRQD
ncbi:unnamed protein product [Meganyctiphanes norvegica]|uniref:Cytosolic fatty-acid binding proteins domain-containing protein n=1 Tax=Meganyctiphanes norvegica TaxID=48144 RepID=A0AAV2RES5_MEGNR